MAFRLGCESVDEDAGDKPTQCGGDRHPPIPVCERRGRSAGRVRRTDVNRLIVADKTEDVGIGQMQQQQKKLRAQRADCSEHNANEDQARSTIEVEQPHGRLLKKRS
ncbi:MAG TPA: hypothetical protein VFW88_06205 [Burkholderiales bacterium]|nr:hypothetical protein [Burkholderiales bacterium]